MTLFYNIATLSQYSAPTDSQTDITAAATGGVVTVVVVLIIAVTVVIVVLLLKNRRGYYSPGIQRLYVIMISSHGIFIITLHHVSPVQRSNECS